MVEVVVDVGKVPGKWRDGPFNLDKDRHLLAPFTLPYNGWALAAQNHTPKIQMW